MTAWARRVGRAGLIHVELLDQPIRWPFTA